MTIVDPLAQSAASTVPDLTERIVALEAEQQRIFDDAQRQADVMFAQYQLSQLLASGDSLRVMAEAVLAELARTSDAATAALWLAEPGERTLHVVAAYSSAPLDGADVATVPDLFEDALAAGDWCRQAGWSGVTLEERRELDDRGFRELALGFVALAPSPGSTLDPDHARFLSLVRHELALAFRTAQLRETLARERAVLSAILDGAGDAIVAVDGDRRIVRLNEAAVTMFGVDTAGAVGIECREFLACGGRPRVRSSRDGAAQDTRMARCGLICPFSEVLAGAPPITNREQTVVDQDGTEIQVAASFARMPGPAAGAVAVLRDLRASHALDELRSSFVAAVSHELRTPLAVVSGYVQSLLHLQLDAPTERRYLERVGETVDRLSELVSQIIDIAHIENDRLALRRFPTHVADVIGGATSELAEIPDTRPVHLDLQPALPLVDVDPIRIRQVLVNLVMNATKYAGRTATITLRAVQGDGFVVVSVEDDGPGIEPDERDHVFDRFYRGQRVRESNVTGSGLGLYLCRRLIEAHGTWIRLEDREVGTTISFALPIASAQSGHLGHGAGRAGRTVRRGPVHESARSPEARIAPRVGRKVTRL